MKPILILLLIASNALAQRRVLEVHLPIHSQIVRVECEHHGRKSYGSGIMIDSKTCLTAVHCVHNFYLTVKYKGRDIKADVGKPQWCNDWIYLHLRETTDAAKIEIRQEPLSDGDVVTSYGFGPPEGKLSWYTSTVRGEVLNGTQPISGDSGGPILDSKGRLCSIICEKFEDGSNNWHGFGLGTTEFLEFVK
jgi:hypothetical protein